VKLNRKDLELINMNNDLTTIEHIVIDNLYKKEVDLTILVPTLNEEITIKEFIDWCKQGIIKTGLSAQILIIDSSTDRTPTICTEQGVEVLRVPKRGLGRAYCDAIPFVSGKYIIMGDADLTYDFRELLPFIKAFKEGADFVMGSRFLGTIQQGSMPNLHRYFGTPLTTWILNRIYGSKYSDIHCGMRGITKDAMLKIDMKSQSWEYASEMVLKAARLRLKTVEVPVNFYKDREGRLSHHRRLGWMSPWIAGWLNLKVMLVYSPDTFLLKPGSVTFVLGLIVSCSLALGPIVVAGIKLNIYWMLLGVTMTTLGYSCIQIGAIAQIMHRLRSTYSQRILRLLTYNRGAIISFAFIAIGLYPVCLLVCQYINNSFKLYDLPLSAVFGLLLIIIGFQTFCFTLLLEMSQRVGFSKNVNK